MLDEIDYLYNFNYLREYSQKQLIIDPTHRLYEKKYEINFYQDHGQNFYKTDLTVLDFLLLDRITSYSVTGLGFEKRAEILQALKADRLNDTVAKYTQIENLKKIVKYLRSSPIIKSELMELMKTNKHFGFFYIKTLLEDYVKLLNLIEKTILTEPEVKNTFQIQDILDNPQCSNLIEVNISLNDISNKKEILNEIFTSYNSSKEQYNKVITKYRKFNSFFNACYNLRIFDLESIKKILTNKTLVDKIYKKKLETLKNSYEQYKQYKITSQEIYTILDKFLDHYPPIIVPCSISTIDIPHVHSFHRFILHDSPEIIKKLKSIKYFPQIFIYRTTDVITEKKLIFVEIRIPFINNSENRQFYSILYNYFSNNIILGSQYLGGMYTTAFSFKNYYDYDNNKFFYTKELFEQYFLYAKKVLGEALPSIQIKPHSYTKFWSKEKNLPLLTKKANERVLKESFNLDISQLKKLVNFHSNLNQNLCDIEKFKQIKQDSFFKDHIKSIKFIPAFHEFGLSQYYLYIHPSDMDTIDLKELLNNTFQTIKYPTSFDNSNSLLINFILPSNNPNVKEKNFKQLINKRQTIREYCLFNLKKVYPLFQFSSNLNVEGWNYNKDEFKKYLQNILFKSDYKIPVSKSKEFYLGRKLNRSFAQNSLEHKSLAQIYNWHSIDIKSYLGTNNYAVISHITDLLQKNLIFPYLSLKNLGLRTKIYIILPNIKQEYNEKLINIFSFFNYGFVYETEGEYYIHGFQQEVMFNNGLMIKLYFPKTQIDEFIQLFELLFEYLEIKDYLILNDLINGKPLLKSIFGNLDFLKDYNPLKAQLKER